MSIRLRTVDLGLEGWTPTTKTVTDTAAGIGTKEPIALTTPLDALTTNAIDGSGVFDKLMQVSKLHLKEEFDNNRITGSDYSNVYLGALQAVLQTSTQFLMNEQQVNQINAQIGLIRQQTVTELASTCDSLPVGLGHNFIPQEITPIPPIT
jgi:hypothetical protein